MVCDIDDTQVPPLGSTQLEWTVEFLQRAAWLRHRTLEVRGSTYVLRRDPPKAQDSMTEGLFAFISGASGSQLDQLLAGEHHVADLPLEAQKSVCQLLSGMYGYASPMLLEKWDELTMSLDFIRSFEYTDATGKTKAWGFDRPSKLNPEKLPPRTKAKTKVKATPLKPSSGELDFGAGSILTVRQIAEKAKEMAGEPFAFDLRVKDELLFVSGKYSKESFAEAIRLAIQPTPARFKPKPVGASILMKGDLSRKLSSLDDEDSAISNEEYVKKSTMSFGAWQDANAGKKPPFSLEPNAQVRLGYRLAMSVTVDFGSHRSPYFTATDEQGRQIGFMPNTFRIGFP